MPQVQTFAPLTIIAMFAGIIEASALATLPFLTEDSQQRYTWFLVGFPFFLTGLFFLTLNFNYKSFYKPDSSSLGEDTDSAQLFTANPGLGAGSQAMAPEPVTVMLSGPAAQAMIEKQILHALAQPYIAEQSWVFCNLEQGQCIRLCISDLPKDAQNRV
ncbi:hypothetical protein [Pseudomonas putida]